MPHEDDSYRRARQVFEDVMIWGPVGFPVPVDMIVAGLGEPDRSFVRRIYHYAAEAYKGVPPRKDGTSAWSHPANVANFLALAKAQGHIIAAGLLHDYLEDLSELSVSRSSSAGDLDRMQEALRAKLARDVLHIAERTGFPKDPAARLVQIVWVLTRHKAERYYRSISAIFNHPDKDVRIGGTQVKLADRMHNILCISYSPLEEQIYQCFKNIFILNNAKLLLVELDRLFGPSHANAKLMWTIHKLFKKCGKATHLALLRVAFETSKAPDMFTMVAYMTLALSKYILERQGLWQITRAELEPGAPVYTIFDGIIDKYDARLHREEQAFQEQFQRELHFLAVTFAELGLGETNLRKTVLFKDAMALKEVVAALLYQQDYMIRGFHCSKLCRRGRNCMAEVASQSLGS